MQDRFIESFNGRLHDELLDCEIFYSLAEAKTVVESWRRHLNMPRPHGSLGYKPPGPEVFIPAMTARAAAQTRSAMPLALAPRPTVHSQKPWPLAGGGAVNGALYCLEYGVGRGKGNSGR